ncbi:hypothetical protein B7453_27320 [Pseudomonas sp. IB20]|uniref:hypothetical protein n=1 Tax=Pseudomonas TaxID=286 RepID=UPI000BA18C69|nr:MULTISPECIES: hypothetical protein [unclassified Pseudomonas]MCV2226906.1 hypothetical protein [Pseudomonas sp. AU10]OZO01369.1 hypothetical protein B7453_27320 [Pseudomonas sp. IB20]WKV17781.1 hypothetical protein [Pseudomonas sp. AU10]
MTEEDMRLALFGPAPPVNEQPTAPLTQLHAIGDAAPAVAGKRKQAKQFARLRVTLRVGNEFEGHTELFTHDADTLSTLQAELDATKIARKKYKFIDVVSVGPVQ